MCGRYYVDDDTAREIEKLVRQVDEKMRQGTGISPHKYWTCGVLLMAINYLD